MMTRTEENGVLPPEWREFEKLVARIERVLAPKGAVVKSPDSCPDLITGSPRQVDASIRFKVGSVPILITVECRKRDTSEDVTWIEQLATKKDDIGAAKTIAVSSSGFYGPAVEKAKLKGIEVRQIEKITPDEVMGWLRIKAIQNVIFRSILEGACEVKLHPADEDTNAEPIVFDSSVTELLDIDAVNAPIFIRNSDGNAFTVNDIVFRSKHKRGFARILYRDIPEDGTKAHRNLKINFERGICHVSTAHGPRDLATLSLGFDVYLEKHETQLNNDDVLVYSDTNKPILYGSEHEIDVLGQAVKFSFYQEPGADELHVIIAPAILKSDHQEASE